jgi:hypothetical protein
MKASLEVQTKQRRRHQQRNVSYSWATGMLIWNQLNVSIYLHTKIINKFLGAIARIHGVGAIFGASIEGNIQFEQQYSSGPARITGYITGLLPDTRAGLYIVQNGRTWFVNIKYCD